MAVRISGHRSNLIKLFRVVCLLLPCFARVIDVILSAIFQVNWFPGSGSLNGRNRPLDLEGDGIAITTILLRDILLTLLLLGSSQTGASYLWGFAPYTLMKTKPLGKKYLTLLSCVRQL